MGKKTVTVIAMVASIVLCGFLIVKFRKKVYITTSRDKAMAEAGHYLFFDTRLSYNNTKSCSSCHDPKFAFTDGYRRSNTANGENVKHNAPSLINISFHNYFDWTNPDVTTLEKQHERPLFNEHPSELGAKGNETMILERFSSEPLYQKLFSAFIDGEKKTITFTNIISAIAAFVKTLKSFNSPYDNFITGDSGALTLSAKSGMTLFFSKKMNCISCHIPPLFTAASVTKNPDSIYFNTGIYNLENKNKYPADDNGLAAISKKPEDDGKFKTPSLRNVSLTAPYMHDGSINTLEEVIEMYQRGGRLTSTGPHAGDGSRNRLKNKMISGFILSPQEKTDLISFLFSLTDSSALKNPMFLNPFNINNK